MRKSKGSMWIKETYLKQPIGSSWRPRLPILSESDGLACLTGKTLLGTKKSPQCHMAADFFYVREDL
ncbi:hypothetical protein [Acetobacterium sp. KB-1]|uniref:hypothetical protein n=1 Tax=Acetobacterium sp. KB-1 TaxID=2184575 RepID=UPI0019550AB1|nr:hypothetical protein [Acetobacterium sp. KB-1]